MDGKTKVAKVYVQIKSIKHSIYTGKNKIRSLLIYQIPEILLNATLKSEGVDNKSTRKEVKNAFILNSKVNIKNREVAVKIVLHEKSRGVFYYDHSEIVKKELPNKSQTFDESSSAKTIGSSLTYINKNFNKTKNKRNTLDCNYFMLFFSVLGFSLRNGFEQIYYRRLF